MDRANLPKRENERQLCKYDSANRLSLVNAGLRQYPLMIDGPGWLVEFDCEPRSDRLYDGGMSAERNPLRFEVPELLSGASDILPKLRQEYHSPLVNTLIGRGASATEAEEILADLWGDCVGHGDDRPSLLEKFSGKCPIRSWLTTVATNRLLDLKRRQKHRGELPRYDSDDHETNPFERLPAAVSARSEGVLVNLLKESLQAAFAKCPPEAMLMLRLAYLNGLSQREVGRMWGWHESKVSRCVSQAMGDIETATLRELKQRDPWLELSWQDFVELCESHEIGFL
jgi:RNA polymerase sigma factor (sigma-70 family)